MRGSSSEPKLDTVRPSSWALYMPLDWMHFSSRGCKFDLGEFRKILPRGTHFGTIQSARHGLLIVLLEFAKGSSHMNKSY
jgi:hypothetical protein